MLLLLFVAAEHLDFDVLRRHVLLHLAVLEGPPTDLDPSLFAVGAFRHIQALHLIDSILVRSGGHVQLDLLYLRRRRIVELYSFDLRGDQVARCPAFEILLALAPPIRSLAFLIDDFLAALNDRSQKCSLDPRIVLI